MEFEHVIVKKFPKGSVSAQTTLCGKRAIILYVAIAFLSTFASLELHAFGINQGAVVLVVRLATIDAFSLHYLHYPQLSNKQGSK